MSEVKVDTISERTTDAGVTVEGVKIEDGVATFQTPAGSPLVFEGATANAFETTFAITDPTADRTITFPDSSFTVPTSGGLFSSYAVIEDQKTLDTNGGTFTSGAWRTRDLNTEVTDPDGIVSISSNQFTLAAGNYLIKWYATAKDVNSHKSALYDITGTAYIDYGSSEDTQDTITVTNKSIGSTRVTPSGSNIYEIRHQCETTDSEEGFGRATGWAVESYCLVEIYKES